MQIAYNQRARVDWVTFAGKMGLAWNEDAYPRVALKIGSSRDGRYIDTFALIDTMGCPTLISRRLAGIISMTVTGETTLSTNMGDGVFQTGEVFFRLTDAPHYPINLRTGILNHPVNTPNVEVLLGMDFLKYGILQLSRRPGESFFRLDSARLADH